MNVFMGQLLIKIFEVSIIDEIRLVFFGVCSRSDNRSRQKRDENNENVFFHNSPFFPDFFLLSILSCWRILVNEDAIK